MIFRGFHGYHWLSHAYEVLSPGRVFIFMNLAEFARRLHRHADCAA